VIVQLKPQTGPHVPEGTLQAGAVIAQRNAIAAASAGVISKLSASDHTVVRQFNTVGYLALELNARALAALEADAVNVAAVTEDVLIRPVEAPNVSLVQGDQVWSVGYDGSGTVIAVLDTGVDSTHPFLAGKVVEEACYSSNIAGVSQSVCPNGQSSQIGPGSAVPCQLSDCLHGTHVAGIAAGNGATGGVPFSGVAKGAQLMAVQVFSQIIDATQCPDGAIPCLSAYESDIMSGLERVATVASQRRIAAANMSLGGDLSAAPCDSDPMKPSIDNLRSLGIASVVASGNSFSGSALTSPACISSAVSVGSSSLTDDVSFFSDIAPFLSLLAPGENINSSVPGGGYDVFSGTSMAAPHVAGAFALLRQAVPSMTVSTGLNTLRQTGLPVTDTRLFFGSGLTTPRIRIFQALASLTPVTSPVPQVTALSPSNARAGTSSLALTVNGSGFNALSVVRWNGANRPTTVVDTGTLQATIGAADLASVGTVPVTVFTPAPGGGTSAALSFSIAPPPSLTISASTVAPGAQETVTLLNGFGGATDWLGLAATGAADSNYLQWVYVGSGVTTRSWTVTMPTAPGTYEFRLYPDNGYSRAATSPPVTVSTSINPVPTLTSLSPTQTYVGGTAFTLTLNGNGFTPASIVRWNGAARTTTYVSATSLQAAITASDIASTGTASVNVLNPAPGGGASSSLSFSIVAGPSLSVNATLVAPGSLVTVTLSGGAGGSADWLALATTDAPNTSYLQFVYVGAGVTTRTWTVNMPATPGTYEFRLFLNNGYTRAATSPTVTVSNSINGVPAISSLSPAQAFIGAGAFTLTVNGGGFSTTSVVKWNGASRTTTYVSATSLQAAILASDVTTIGTASVSVQTPAPGGGTSAAISFPIVAGPTLAVSATTVAGGSPVTVTLTGGLGGVGDWIAFAASGAPDTSYLQYTYVGAGVTTRTWTVTVPVTAGGYEFRLYLNNGYSRAATSPAVTVSSSLNPIPTITSLSPAQAVLGSAFNLTVYGTGFTSTSVVKWNGVSRTTTFIGSTTLQVAVSASDTASIGTATVSVQNPSPGGGTSGTLSFSIIAPPILTVSATTVTGGTSVTVTLTNGLGGLGDWLALAATGSPATSYLQYTYIGSGVTSFTWTVMMPTTAGTYEFRLFANNGYMLMATSPTVTVSP
jgi:subtilisin family serine protease